jgi:gamma-glutamyl:cysteine ligase YbdK (ATP-grasp superfamily)
MSEPDRDTVLRTIEDFEATLTEFQSNNVVLATTVLLRRLAEIEASAHELGDPILIAMVEKLLRHLATGKGLDG